MDDDTSTIYFYGWSKRELTELLCPPLDPYDIVNLGRGDLVHKGQTASVDFYIQLPVPKCKELLGVLLIEDISFESRSNKTEGKWYVARKPDVDIKHPHIMMGKAETVRMR